MTLEDVNKHRSDIRSPPGSKRRFKRNGVSRAAKLWPNARIPYTISSQYTSHERALLARAVKEVGLISLLNFGQSNCITDGLQLVLRE